MSDPESTLPPRQPNTPRVWLKRLLDAALDHLAITIPVLTFIAGLLLGRLL